MRGRAALSADPAPTAAVRRQQRARRPMRTTLRPRRAATVETAGPADLQRASTAPEEPAAREEVQEMPRLRPRPTPAVLQSQRFQPRPVETAGAVERVGIRPAFLEATAGRRRMAALRL